MSVKIDFNASSILNKVGASGGYVKMKQALANEIVTVTDPLVPFREGFLKNSATIAADGSFFMYDTDYAKRLYYNPQFNFSGAPIRGGLWVERSMSINEQAIEQAMQGMANRGLFK